MGNKKTSEEILKDLRKWIQNYVIAWSGEEVNTQNIMFKELDRVFEKTSENHEKLKCKEEQK